MLSGKLNTALIWSAKNFALQPCGGYLAYFKFAHSRTETIYLLLHVCRYSFEGCYFGAIIHGNAKIAKTKCITKYTSHHRIENY